MILRSSQFMLGTFYLPYNQMFMNKRLLVTTLILTVALSCTPNTNIDDIVSGSASFAVSTKTSAITTSTFDQKFTQTFSQVPNVAFTLQSISANTQTISDWFIKAESISNSGFKIIFRYKSVQWTSVRVGFWASARSDLVVGSTTSTKRYFYSDFNPLQAGADSILVNLPSNFIYSPACIARVFVTGYTLVSGSEISIKVFDKKVTSNSLEIGVQVGGSMQVENIYVNFIVMNPQTKAFVSYGGAASQSKLYNFQKFIHSTPYKIFGISSLNQSNSGPFSINAQFDNQFYLQIDTNQVNNFFLSYVVIGYPFSATCALCSNKIVAENGCINQCSSNTYLVTLKDGGKACRSCPAQYNLVLNQDGTGCVCRDGFMSVGGQCISGPASGIQVTVQPSNTLVYGQNVNNAVNVAPNVLINSVGINAVNVAPNVLINSVFTAPNKTTPTFIAVPIVQPSANVQPMAPPTQSYVPNQPMQPQQQSNNVAPVSNSNTVTFQMTNTAQGQSKLIPTAQVQTQGQSTFTPTAPIAPTSNNCLNQPNTYWTGYRCACRVGYLSTMGVCSPIQDIFKPTRPAEFIDINSGIHHQYKKCYGQFESFDGTSCVCISGYTRGSDRKCSENIINDKKCVNGVFSQFGMCVCNPGFSYNNQGICSATTTCGVNSYANELNICVCKTGFSMDKNICVANTIICPPYSEKDVNGVCQCINGFKKFDGVSCSQCSAGQILIGGGCTTTCGINEYVKTGTNKCECLAGYGKFLGVCNICPSDFFLNDGFCVTCVLSSTYDPVSKTCKCNDGVSLIGGICPDQCTKSNEVYSISSQKCVCYSGLGRNNGICDICANGRIDPVTENCISGCDTYEYLQSGTCVCQSGYGRDSNSKCAKCELIGGFLSSGLCVFCPSNQVQIGKGCGCQPGSTFSNGVCSSTCRTDQLIDDKGNCYSCLINEAINQGMCDCKSGYQRVSGVCQLSCPAGQNIINGQCGICIMGTVFNQILGSCVCPSGQYMANDGLCSIVTISCQPGTFIDGNLCTACPTSCATCSSAYSCTTCKSNGFYPNGPLCLTRCGDGIKAGQEFCDDENTVNGDGCSSTCTIEQAQPVPPVNPITPKIGITLFGQPNYNFNNIYTVLLMDQPIIGLNPDQKREFIKYNFPDSSTQPTSAYCTQRDQNSFTCIFMYPNGMLNRPFSTQFSCIYKGLSGYIKVDYNPLTSVMGTRSLH